MVLHGSIFGCAGERKRIFWKSRAAPWSGMASDIFRMHFSSPERFGKPEIEREIRKEF
jgi:hypothetical protein